MRSLRTRRNALRSCPRSRRRRSSPKCAATCSPASTTSPRCGRSSATRDHRRRRAATSSAASTTSTGLRAEEGGLADMVARFDLNDDGVVVVVGSGAGGGTLSNELAQKGIKVVCLEAGGRHEIEDFVNDEWASFGNISWLDKRTTSGTWRVAKDFSGLPAWIVKAVGGSTIHWAG